MGIIHKFNAPSTGRTGAAAAQQGQGQGTLPPAAPPPYDGDMEARVKALEVTLPTLATKADLADLRADFAGLKGELKSGISDLRADMHKADASHKTWILATVLAVLGTGVGVVTFLRNAPPAPAPQQQPIIINIPATPAPSPPVSR